MSKRAVLGSYQLGFVRGFTRAVRLLEDRHPAGGFRLDFEGLIFACIFQAGIDQFLIPRSLGDDNKPKSRFIIDRSKSFKPDADLQKVLQQSLWSHLSPDEQRDDRFRPVGQLQSFLEDLLYAMQTRASLISLIPIPTATELQGLLPLELWVPLNNLLSGIERITLAAPIPQLFFTRDSLRRFKHILTSSLFSKYTDAHMALDEAHKGRSGVIKAITTAAKKIVNVNSGLLELSSVSSGLFPLTSKVIDVTFGKLPGVLAEIATAAATVLLEERRRVVVYEFEPILKKLFLSHVAQLYFAEFAPKWEISPEITKEMIETRLGLRQGRREIVALLKDARRKR